MTQTRCQLIGVKHQKTKLFSLKSRETQRWGKACAVPFLILSPRARAVGLFTEENACETRTACTRKVRKFLDLTFQLDFRGVAKTTTRHSDRVALIQKAFIFFFFFSNFFSYSYEKGLAKGLISIRVQVLLQILLRKA